MSRLFLIGEMIKCRSAYLILGSLLFPCSLNHEEGVFLIPIVLEFIDIFILMMVNSFKSYFSAGTVNRAEKICGR